MMGHVNGKPGDHPLTDILAYRLEVFGAVADALIREICDLGGHEQLERQFDLLSIDPRFQRLDRPPLDVPQFEAELQRLRDDLRAEAVRRGWEVAGE